MQVPDVKVHDKEKAIWDKIRDAPRITSAMPSETFDALSKLRDSNVNLSSRSVSFLCLEHEEELMTFMQKNKNEEIQEKAVITCMETLALNKDDEYSVRRLVVGRFRTCSSRNPYLNLKRAHIRMNQVPRTDEYSL